jgi:ElaB/YqjD/DUF883 family membrane-anchored ribosome-binding protein
MPTDGFSWPFWHHEEPMSKEKVTEVHSIVDEPLNEELPKELPKKNPEVFVDPALKDSQLEDPSLYRDYHVTLCDTECEKAKLQGWSLQGLLGGWLRSLFGPILGMKETVKETASNIKESASNLKDKVEDKIDDLEGLLHDKGKATREKLKEEFRIKHNKDKHEHPHKHFDIHKHVHDIKDKADDTFRGTVDNVKETIVGVKENIVEMKDKVSDVKDKVMGAYDKVEGKVRDAQTKFEKAADAVKDKVEHNIIVDTVKNLMGSATEKVGEKIEETGKKIEETGQKMKAQR